MKEALLDMSHDKCAYCECMLGMESKDATIDHFLPKVNHKELVVEWENMFPACLRCNRKKNDHEDKIVNPCYDTPSDFIALDKTNPFRLKGIDDAKVGKNTILSIGLNDIERVMKVRMVEWEDIHERLEELCEELQDHGYQKKYKFQLEKLMEKCTAINSYAAVKATNMLRDKAYADIKSKFIEDGVWTSKFQELEKELTDIALQIW